MKKILILAILLIACAEPDPTCRPTEKTRVWLQIVPVGKVMVPIWHRNRLYECAADKTEWRADR